MFWGDDQVMTMNSKTTGIYNLASMSLCARCYPMTLLLATKSKKVHNHQNYLFTQAVVLKSHDI